MPWDERRMRAGLSAKLVLWAILAVAMPSAPAEAASATTLFSFRDDKLGKHPWTAVARDPQGAIYGTTLGGGTAGFGTVFRLSPSGSGWRRTVLHHFAGGQDGRNPLSALIRAPDGALYGTTETGGGGDCSGGCGTVFELKRRSDGSWAYRVIQRFPKAISGARPSGRLAVLDGAVYGTTSTGGTFGGGTVYRLRPTSTGGWTRTVLHHFRGGSNDGQYPRGGVAFGPDGALYGTTETGGRSVGALGTVFRLAPSNGVWRIQLLHRFTGGSDGAQPIGPVSFDFAGAVYGVTPFGGKGSCFQRCGTVFQIAPTRAGTWVQRIIHRFEGGSGGAFPRDGVHVDGAGRVFGTAASGGTTGSFGVAYRLVRVADERLPWTRTILHRFTGPPAGGAAPVAGLSDAGGGAFYGTTRDGGAGYGTVFRLTP